MGTIESRVIEVLVEQFGVQAGDLSRETTIADDLGADSLDGMEVVLELEDEFDIVIPDGDINENAKITVGMIVDYISGRMRDTAL
jgi:acyl carrier protein